MVTLSWASNKQQPERSKAVGVEQISSAETLHIMDAIGVLKSNPLDDYELLHRIGSGTYGDVYKVHTVIGLSDSNTEKTTSWSASTLWPATLKNLDQQNDYFEYLLWLWLYQSS